MKVFEWPTNSGRASVLIVFGHPIQRATSLRTEDSDISLLTKVDEDGASSVRGELCSLQSAA